MQASVAAASEAEAALASLSLSAAEPDDATLPTTAAAAAGDKVEDAAAAAKDTDDTPERIAALETLRFYLGRQMRCTMIDQRVLVGTFACTDRDSNIILGGCLEYQSLAECQADSRDCRALGLAMIPGDKILTLEIDNFSSGTSPGRYYAQNRRQSLLYDTEGGELDDIGGDGLHCLTPEPLV